MTDQILPYIETGAPTEEEGQALAAAGVLQAAGFVSSSDRPSHPDELRMVLGAAIASAPDVSLAWQSPRQDQGSLGTEVALAAAWRDAFEQAEVSRPARLMMQVDDAIGSTELDGVLRRLQAPLVSQQAALGLDRGWRDFEPGLVAGISLLAARPNDQLTRQHAWSWPLRTNFPPFAPTAEQGFVVREPWLPLDIEIAKAADIAGNQAGVRLQLDGSLHPSDALRLNSINERPLALASIDPVELPKLLAALSVELARDAPLDFALNLAWLRQGLGGALPVFVAADRQWPAQLESTRLHRRVVDLIAILRQYRAGESFLIDRPLPALGLGSLGRISATDLANQLERALARPDASWDRDNDAATDLLALGRAVGGLTNDDSILRGMQPFDEDSHDGEGYDDPADRDAYLPSDNDSWSDEAGYEADADEGEPLHEDFDSDVDDVVELDGTAGDFGEPPPPEVERFADLTLYDGFHFGALSPAEARRVGPRERLKAQHSYTLEVAIRRKRIGIDAQAGTAPVAPPADRRDPAVLAVVSCRQPNAPKFENRLLSIIWQRNTDSTSALFRFETLDALPPDPLCFEVRLYARVGLQLLDVLELRFTRGMLRSRWVVHQPQHGRLATPDLAPSEDAMTFHVSAKPGGYDFEVVFTRNGEPHLDAPLGRLVSDADLASLLSQVRSYWTGLVIGKLGTRTRLTAQGYAGELARIADLGACAWRTLFGDRVGAGSGTPEALGETLRYQPLPVGAPLRVTFANDADAFVFPWAILCAPRPRDTPAIADAIWGLRYRIELTRKYCEPLRPSRAAGEVRIASVVDPNFGSVDHAATLGRVAEGAAGVRFVEGAGTTKAVLEGLEAQPPCDLYYYFCHGFAPGREAVLAKDLLKNVKAEVDLLADSDKQPWRSLLDRLGEESDVAAMFTGAARITENDLRGAKFFTTGRPIVFLNMCHSADLLPSLRSGLTRVFIDRNAAAVLGTECPVTSVFADMFAEKVLGAMLQGETIGAALLKARKHFCDQKNPLGLLYTLYGHEDARLAVAAAA